MKDRLIRFAVVLVLLAVLGIGTYVGTGPPGPSLFHDFTPQSLRKAWTIVGHPGSPNVAFMDGTGAVQPGRDAYSAHWFVYDKDEDKLYSPLLGNMRRRSGFWVVEGHHQSWSAERMRIRERVLAHNDTCAVDLSIQNTGGKPLDVSLFVAAVPYKVMGLMGTGYELNCDRPSRALTVDRRVMLQSVSEPSDAGTLSGDDGTDITCYIRKGALPRARRARGKSGLASGAMRFDMRVKADGNRVLSFLMPMTDSWRALTRSQTRKRLQEVRQGAARAWTVRLDRVRIEVPDARVTRCWELSAIHLITLCGDGAPTPGPAKYRSFWVRDAAYIADALYYAGQADLIPPALEQLRKMQLPDGSFIAKSGGSPNELDAQGEAVYAFVQQYRRTGDKEALRRAWPCILSACEYIRSKRIRGSGILPASLSAEDLGSGDQQHYWDDFWCVRGLRDAAFAARELGNAKDEAWMRQQADSLLQATLASVRQLKTSYIPNGPQDLTSSAMARGTSCALWPCDVLDLDDSLTRRSFDHYWNKWIAPSGGGFVHKDHFWPYAGLDLAISYLMLGQRERTWTILNWTLEHDPTKGFYSYPEGMFTDDLTLAEGDMPHGWTCASYLALVRNMLVRESDGGLALLSGVPEHWLRPGNSISCGKLPTQFGKISFTAQVTGGSLRIAFQGAKPNARLRVDLPGRNGYHVPPSAREVTIPLR